jgi:hypothetical protein
MANPHRGEVALTVGDKAYTLSFGINAMCELEALLKRSIVEVALELEMVATAPTTLRMSTIRAVTWAALRDHHPSITEHEAGEIVGEAGFAKVMEVVLQAIHAAFPASAGKGGGSRPPAAGG